LYSDFRLNTQDRDTLIRQRAASGERPSDVAREYGINTTAGISDTSVQAALK